MIEPKMSRSLQQVYEDLHRRELKARDEIMTMYPSLTEREVAALSPATVKPATIRDWRRDGKIFVVPYHGEDRYPAYQFKDGLPKRVIGQVLNLLAPSDSAERTSADREPPYSDWATAFWFASANAWLEEGQAPVDLIDIDPAAVVEAASHARDRISD